MSDLFDKDFIESLGYNLIKDDGKCGIATSKEAGGKKQLSWNREGISCDYFGNKLEPNIAFGVRDDWDTRYTFNGYVRTKEHIKLIVELTR